MAATNKNKQNDTKNNFHKNLQNKNNYSVQHDNFVLLTPLINKMIKIKIIDIKKQVKRMGHSKETAVTPTKY